MPDWLCLALLLTIPPLGSIALVVIIFKQKEDSCHSEIKKIFQLDEKSLHAQRIFWHSIILPVLYFLALCIVFWEDYDLSLTVDGINTFWDLGKLQLAVLSTSIPLSVLASRAHSTHQTAVQIRNLNDTNNRALLNKHRSDFFDYFDRVSEVKYSKYFTGKFKVHAGVYTSFFIVNNELGEYAINSKTFSKLAEQLTKMKEVLGNLLYTEATEEGFFVSDLRTDEFSFGESTGYFYQLYEDYCYHVRKLSELLLLSEIDNSFPYRSIIITIHINEFESYSWRTIGKSTEDAISVYRYIYQYYVELCRFAQQESDRDLKIFFEQIDPCHNNKYTESIELLHKHVLTQVNGISWA